MHEQVYAKKVIEEAEKHGEVTGIKLLVGELAPITAQELKEAIHNLRPDWEIEVEEQPAKVECVCGFTGRPEIIERAHDHVIYKCSKCGNLMPTPLEGNKIKILEVKVK